MRGNPTIPSIEYLGHPPCGAEAGAGALQQVSTEVLQQSWGSLGLNFSLMASKSGPELAWTAAWSEGATALATEATGSDGAAADTPASYC